MWIILKSISNLFVHCILEKLIRWNYWKKCCWLEIQFLSVYYDIFKMFKCILFPQVFLQVELPSNTQAGLEIHLSQGQDYMLITRWVNCEHSTVKQIVAVKKSGSMKLEYIFNLLCMLASYIWICISSAGWDKYSKLFFFYFSDWSSSRFVLRWSGHTFCLILNMVSFWFLIWFLKVFPVCL